MLYGVFKENFFSRKVKYQEGITFMKENNMHFFFETSALQGKNIEIVIIF